MKELNLIKEENGQAVTTSLQVAKTFGKKHKDVLEAYDNLMSDGVAENSADLFHESKYTHPQNKQEYRMVVMNRDGWTLLAMGFTGKKATQFKMKYIEAFNKMEKHIAEQQPKLPTNPMEILALTFEAQQQTNERVSHLEEVVTDIQEKALISTEDANSLNRMVRSKIHSICKMQRLDSEAKSLLFADLGKSIKQLFNVPHRGRIKDKDYQRAIDFVSTWEPSSVTKAQISQMTLDL